MKLTTNMILIAIAFAVMIQCFTTLTELATTLISTIICFIVGLIIIFLWFNVTTNLIRDIKNKDEPRNSATNGGKK